MDRLGLAARDRDRAILAGRLTAAAATVGASLLTAVFSATAASSYTPPRPAAPPTPPPAIPAQPAPEQVPAPTPRVITHVVHVPAATVFIQAPAQAPRSSRGGGYAPPPPGAPAPGCVSTPSMPC